MNLPENIKAVIFDFDGLMIDSEPSWKKTHSEFLGKHNIVMDENDKANLRGTGLKQLIIEFKERFHLGESVGDLLNEYRKIFYRNFSTREMMEGVEEVVKAFYGKGYKLAIATGGHTVESMRKMLDGFNFSRYFGVIVSGDEVEKGKPNPDTFLLAAERLGVMPTECLVLEDSVNGVLAGKRAGMITYGVNSDQKIYDNLRKGRADEVFYNLKELL